MYFHVARIPHRTYFYTSLHCAVLGRRRRGDGFHMCLLKRKSKHDDENLASRRGFVNSCSSSLRKGP